MDDAYAILGLARRLVIGRDEVQAAFREAGKSAHPDAGGSEQAFAALKSAQETLLSPARRLKHWLQLHGVLADGRGTVSPDLMDWFSKVGELSQRVEALIRRREEAKSALGKAMLEGETQRCREELERMIAALDGQVESRTAVFAEWERAAELDVGIACAVHRDLGFLEKWLASLRGQYGRLL